MVSRSAFAGRRSQLGVLATVFLLTPFLSGCGGGGDEGRWVSVSGRVTYDSEPLSAASVHFVHHRSGSDFVAELDAEGRYDVELAEVQTGDTFDVYFGPKPGDSGEVDEAGTPLPNPPPAIPSKYLRPETSEIAFSVEDGSNMERGFDLQAE